MPKKTNQKDVTAKKEKPLYRHDPAAYGRAAFQCESDFNFRVLIATGEFDETLPVDDLEQALAFFVLYYIGGHPRLPFQLFDSRFEGLRYVLFCLAYEEMASCQIETTNAFYSLIKTCIAFANGVGEKIIIGIDDKTRMFCQVPHIPKAFEI